MTTRRAFLLAAAGLVAAGDAGASDGREEARAWDSLREGGLVILMRHASTEAGYGDPAHFRVDDCATQRNLSEAGRAEARRVGDRIRRERVRIARVYTSPWCRCRETATLAFGNAEDWDPLSSFFEHPDREAELVAAVKRRIASYARRKPAGNVVMVTHNVNIAALSRESVAPAELVVMRPSGCCDAKAAARLKIG